MTLSLLSGSGSAGDATGDSYSSIENVSGSAYNDQLTGNTAANYLSGGDGRDMLDGGEGDDTLHGGSGADTLNGGEDLDVADYSGSNAAININLQAMTVTGGHGTGDVLSGIDGVMGTGFDDTIIGFDQYGLSGDVYTNVLWGGGGNDYIDARSGNDSVYGGDGNDTILAGAGDDTATGDAGNDSLDGGTGNDNLFGRGTATTRCRAAPATTR